MTMNEMTTLLKRMPGRVGQALILAVLLTSCAVIDGRVGADRPEAQPVAAPAAGLSAADLAAPDSGPGRPAQQLTDDMMFDILLAEIAGQRGEMDISVTRYLQAANEARDPRVAERAVQIASYAKRYDLALEAAKRWVLLDNENLDAHKALTALALQQGDLDEVVTQMDYLLRNSADPEENFRMITVVLARHEDKQAVVNATRQLVDRYPGNPYAWMSLSRLAVVAGQLDTAMDAVDHVLALRPEMATAIILKAQVMLRQERKADATRLLKDAAEKYPQNTDLLFTYGRMLLDGEDLAAAKQQFHNVVKVDPEHADGLYSLALLELETKNYRSGEKYLKQLLELDEHVQNAYYYLGYAAREQGKDEAALGWYLRVESGDYWNQSQLHAASIMVKRGEIERMHEYMRGLRQKNPLMAIQLFIIEGQALTDAGLNQEAFDLYSSALQHTPDEEDLLYSHSLAAERLGKLDVAEKSLRSILAQDPDNVRTLNALGYTLADRTDRYQEALQYISKAYAQEPDDPAIVDSMGWVYFRLGDLDKAREYLQKAWEISKDSEIGAHYGEVLWIIGERDTAMQVWEVSRQANPDDPLLLEVINRLNP